MNKKGFMIPIVLLSSTPGKDDVIGGGTGQGNPGDVYSCDYDEWLIMFETDMDNDRDCDWTDYTMWMHQYGWDDDINPTEDPGY